MGITFQKPAIDAADDEEDWVEIEPVRKSSGVIADVTIKLTRARSKTGKIGAARVYLAFRDEAAQWIADNGPRFRVEYGRKGSLIRIVPDMERGKFEQSLLKGVERLCLGHVAIWPNEERESTALDWDAAANWMKLTLPDGFLEPREGGAAR